MPDIPSKRATTRLERSQYWRQVGGEAWELSREQFQRHHEIIVAAIAFAFVWYVRGRKEMVNELFTSLFYVATPVGLYLAGLFIFNFIRATIRVPVYRQREISDLKSETERLKTQQIQFTITAHPASPANPEAYMSIPVFIVNQSPQHRIVLSFTLCLPLSNGKEYRQHKVSLGEVKPSLGPEEHTSGTISFFLGSPKDNNITMLFREAYLLVKDLVSTESVKVKIPGKFPSE